MFWWAWCDVNELEGVKIETMECFIWWCFRKRAFCCQHWYIDWRPIKHSIQETTLHLPSLERDASHNIQPMCSSVLNLVTALIMVEIRREYLHIAITADGGLCREHSTELLTQIVSRKLGCCILQIYAVSVWFPTVFTFYVRSFFIIWTSRWKHQLCVRQCWYVLPTFVCHQYTYPGSRKRTMIIGLYYIKGINHT